MKIVVAIEGENEQLLDGPSIVDVPDQLATLRIELIVGPNQTER